MANDFTARVAGISVELGMSVQNKSGIWCKPMVDRESLQRSVKNLVVIPLKMLRVKILCLSNLEEGVKALL